VLAQKAQCPEFKSQYHKKEDRKSINLYVYCGMIFERELNTYRTE
jgi:hypothetical protein